jgi:hypothetical protein
MVIFNSYVKLPEGITSMWKKNEKIVQKRGACGKLAQCVVGIIVPKWPGHFGSSLGQQTCILVAWSMIDDVF